MRKLIQTQSFYPELTQKFFYFFQCSPFLVQILTILTSLIIKMMNISPIKAIYLLLAFLLAVTLIRCHRPQNSGCNGSHDHDHFHDEAHHHHTYFSGLITITQVWGLLAGLTVSLIGFVTALVIVKSKNLVSDLFFETFMKFLFGLAFGTLLGDSMIHTLPEVYKSGHGDFKILGGILIGSIVFFLILERFFESYGISHDHGYEHQRQNQLQAQNPHPHAQNLSFWQKLKGKGTAGYMNLLGSFIHNFIDGLAIGVAFATGDRGTFIPLFVAIVAHEIPRQMGDVAILMENQFDSTQTVLCNGVINLISLYGVVIGLTYGKLDEVSTNYVLVFIAGNFIFIAADIWRNLFRNKKMWKNLIELIGIVIGVGLMFLILNLEGHEHSHGHIHGHGHEHQHTHGGQHSHVGHTHEL